LAEELNLPYELVDVDRQGPDGQSRDANYAAINPNMRVPAINDNGFHLWESMAINLYLAKQHSQELYPQAAKAEALLWQWSFWAIGETDLQMIEWALHDHALPDGERDPTKAATAWDALQRPLAVLDTTLSRSAYLIGDQFTVADLNVASVMYRAHAMDLDRFSHIKNWFHGCWERPAAKRARALRGDV
jgi:glutathione S-transferase